MILVSDLVGSLDGLQSLHSLARSSNINHNLASNIQDKTVSFVHGWYVQLNLFYPDILNALDLEQPLLVVVTIDMLEATLNAAREVSDTGGEVVEESLRLMVLDLAELDGGTTEMVIQIYGENGGRTGLILGGLCAKPKVDVPAVVVVILLGLKNRILNYKYRYFWRPAYVSLIRTIHTICSYKIGP